MPQVLYTILEQLNQKEFDNMIMEVSPQEDSKAVQMLRILRENSHPESDLPNKLNLTKGAYYTLKSRLVPKVVSHYTNLKQNKIRQLTEEAARVPFIVFNNEREVSLSYLKELEKKLREYDLSSELAVVYKHLARLNRFEDEHSTYEREYQKHIAFALSVSKAEDLLYEFIYYLGYYRITYKEDYRQKLEEILDEMENTYELYESHRLFVIFNIVKIYYQCSFSDIDDLCMKELEIEQVLQRFIDIFDKYDLDPFYSVIRNVVPFLYFEYYVKIGNRARSMHYLEQVSALIRSQFKAHLWSFFITQFIISIKDKLKLDNDLNAFLQFRNTFRKGYVVDEKELSHLVIFFRYKALADFYSGEYGKAALVVNNLRNITSFKNFIHLEIEMKLFQAMMYALNGEEELLEKLLASAKRQARESESLRISVKNFGKLLNRIQQEKENGNNKVKLLSSWQLFRTPSGNPARLLDFLYMKDDWLLKIT